MYKCKIQFSLYWFNLVKNCPNDIIKVDDNDLDSKQIYFVNQIIEYIVQNGLMKDISVLQEAPFTDRGSIVEIFKELFDIAFENIAKIM